MWVIYAWRSVLIGAATAADVVVISSKYLHIYTRQDVVDIVSAEFVKLICSVEKRMAHNTTKPATTESNEN